MNILAIDTSSIMASAAIMADGYLIGEYVISNGKTHSQIIIPLISDMLDKAGMTIKDIDVFATSLGPGSFTGLRIGVATAKSFAQAMQKEIIGISSLAGLCANVACNDDMLICPIIDARRGNVYNAVYKSGTVITADRIISLDEVLDEVKDMKTLFLGDGIVKHREKIENVMGDKAFFAPGHFAIQRASSIAYLANLRAEKGDFDNLYSLEPIYVRASQAERELCGEKD